MILIITSKYDKTTQDIVDWLKSENQNFEILYDFIGLEIKKIEISNEVVDFMFTCDKKKFIFSKIDSIWYRRGELYIESFINKIVLEKSNKDYSKSFKYFFENELNDLKEYIEYLILQKIHINSPLKYNCNKLIALNYAKSLGLKIPYTTITSSKNQLCIELSAQKKLITKSICNNPHITNQIKNYWALTKQITIESDFKEVNSEFFPSLFQKKIEKQFEVRSFYLSGQIFSMAIFSQANAKTQLDYRNYDDKAPNRNIPFKLPKEIELKVLQLAKLTNINCGSIDFIYDKHGDFYFLEINPIGQFGSVSYNCNYNLEQIIASHLYEKK